MPALRGRKKRVPALCGACWHFAAARRRKKRASCFVSAARAASAKQSMNTAPITLRFCSGSVIPRSAPRNLARASTTSNWRFPRPPKASHTSSLSPARSKPLSTKIAVSWSPTARCSRDAVTALSTPPLSPSNTRSSPTRARITLSASAMKLAGDQPPRQPHIAKMKLRRMALPCGVCATSGWNCRPYRPRPSSPMAA